MSDGIFTNNVAGFDQQHAAAMEQLRHAGAFLLATLVIETGEVHISIAIPNTSTGSPAPGFCRSVIETLIEFIEQTADEE
jgi:hypothetical protein